MQQRNHLIQQPVTAAICAGLLGALYALLGLDGFFWSDDFWLLPFASTHGIFDWWFTTPADFAPYWPKWAGLEPGQKYYLYMRPLTTLSLKIDYLLWGYWAPGYHMTQALLAGASVAAFYAAARRFAGNSVAFWAALLFAILPVQAEARCWIAARSGLLSSTLLFAAVAIAGSAGVKPWLRTTLASVVLVLGLSAKSDAAMAIPWLLALAWVPPRKDLATRRQVVITAATLTILATLYLVVTRVVLAPESGSRMDVSYLADGGLGRFLANLSQYLISLHSQIIPAAGRSMPWFQSLAIIGGVAFIWWAVLRRSNNRLMGYAVAMLAVLPLLPASLFIPNERHMLLSAAGISLLLMSLVVPRWPGWSRMVKGLSVTVLVLLALLSISHHRSAASLGYSTRDYAQSIIDSCSLPQPGGRLYLAGVLPSMTQVDSALSMLRQRREFEVVILSLDLHSMPQAIDVPSEARFWYCLASTYGCPPVKDQYSLEGQTLRVHRPKAWFFDSSADRMGGYNRRYQGKQGRIFKETGHFSVDIARLHKDNGMPVTLDFALQDSNATLCIGQGVTFSPVSLKP